MENFDANAGTNKLANVLSDRMRRENDTSLCLDFGEIQGNGSLITNTFPVAIPLPDEIQTTATISQDSHLAEHWVVGSPTVPIDL